MVLQYRRGNPAPIRRLQTLDSRLQTLVSRRYPDFLSFALLPAVYSRDPRLLPGPFLPPDPNSLMTIGQRLRAAREAKDLTIGDIARRTNIQPRFLQAIDEDNLGTIPQSHQKLFIREYAKLVGLQPEVILAELPDYSPPPPPAATDRVFVDNEAESGGDAEPTERPSARERFNLRRNIPALPHKRGVKMSGSNASNLLMAAALVLLVVIGVWYFLLRDNKASVDSASGDGSDTLEGSPTEIITSQDTTDSAATGTPIGEGDSLTLEGRATAKVWYSMLMDGQRSENGTLDSGAVKTWRAWETFRLSLGNAGGLDLYLNDRPLGTLGPKLSAVRNQIIDANGIRKKGMPPAPPRTTTGASAPQTAPRTTTAPQTAVPRTEAPAQQTTPARTAPVRAAVTRPSTRTAPRTTTRRPTRRTTAATPPRQITPADVRPPGVP
jgi:cytoskeletal protein RodZ